MKKLKLNLYTVILYYKNHTYYYQLRAQNENDAQSKWAEEIDLFEIGVDDVNKVKAELISDSKKDDEQPGLLQGLQSVWYASISTRNLLDSSLSAGANIVTTCTKNTISNQDNVDFNMNNLFNFKKNTFLYTIQLDYKGGSYAYQVCSLNPLSAKIQWLKEFDFNVVYGIPKNMLEIKNNILSQRNDPEFIPQELPEFQSVWITKLELGNDIGRVTIVATQTNIISLPRSHN